MTFNLMISCCKNLIFSSDERKIFNQPSQRILYPVELAHGVRPQAMPAEICTFRRQEVCTLMSERGKSTGGCGLNESECMSVSKFLSERQIGPNYRIILNVSFWLLKAGKKIMHCCRVLSFWSKVNIFLRSLKDSWQIDMAWGGAGEQDTEDTGHCLFLYWGGQSGERRGRGLDRCCQLLARC